MAKHPQAESKSPAFQFYAENFLNGTADMTASEVGTYIRLLCHQWHKGGLPNDDKRLMQLSGGKKSDILNIRSKFSVDTDGMLRNERMEKTREEQKEYREKQKAKADLRWGKSDATASKRHTSGTCQTDALHSSSTTKIQNTEIQNNTAKKGAVHFEHIKEFFSHPYEKQFEDFKARYTKKEYEGFQGFLTGLFRDFTMEELTANFDKCISIGDWKRHFKCRGFMSMKPAIAKALSSKEGNRDNFALRVMTFTNGVFDEQILQR